MSELKKCPFCGSTAVVKCRVDSDWGVDLKYRLLNDESNYDIKSMIADENYDSDERSGDYWGIEIFRCQSCRAQWGEGTDVCVAALNARIAELEGVIEILEDQQREVKNILIDKNLHIDSLYEEGYKLQQRIAELEEENDRLLFWLVSAEEEIDQLTAHSDIERQDDKSSNDTQTQTIVYGKEDSEVQE
jgi:TolA-binding protein